MICWKRTTVSSCKKLYIPPVASCTLCRREVAGTPVIVFLTFSSRNRSMKKESEILVLVSGKNSSHFSAEDEARLDEYLFHLYARQWEKIVSASANG